MPDRTCPDTCVKVRSDISDVLEEQCLCPTGSYFTNETCQDCGPFTYGQNCELTCNCEPNTTVSCAVRTGECTCLAGWSCSSCSEDVNECYTVYCGPNAYCLNTLGAYTCTCYPGFGRNSNGTCQRYYCHTTLRASSATIVSPNYPANYNNNDNCSWLITVEQTSIISIRFLELDTECNYDYVTVFDGMDRSRRLGAFCSITNLVLASTSNSMFVTFTSDEIVTKKGFLLSYNSFACPPLTYGPNCSYACNCDQNNTCYCNRTTGQCICKSGWTSYNCSRDVNEWANASNPSCPEFSSCSNLNGSYECLCYEGLQRDRDGLCDAKNDSICTRRNCSHVCAKIKNQDQRLVEHCYCPIGTEPIGDICQTCGNGTYGQDCNAKCDCVTENTASCNPVNGRCTCLPGWTSKACELDVNECYQYNIYFGSYSQCVNTPGSYECVCFPGYETGPYGNCVKASCNKTLSNTTGVIKSPNYPVKYFDNTACSWTIQAPTGHVISLRFFTFALERQQKCTYDSLSFYDGSSSHARSIGVYCGLRIPGLIRTHGNNLYIAFKGDGSVTFMGFYTAYSFHVCEDFTYGDTCSMRCSCDRNNTQFCDNTNGVCVCKPGWMGGNCSIDIDECQARNCQDNEVCENSPGSFLCTCKPEYTKNITGLCEALSNCKLKNCSHSCYIMSPGVEQCMCPDGLILDKAEHSTCVVPFYPYGFTANDNVLKYDMDVDRLPDGTLVSKPIYYNTGVPIGRKNYLDRMAYVFSTGTFKFGDAGIPGSPDLTAASEGNHSLFAPYWANMDPSKGSTFHHLYERCDSPPSLTDSQMMTLQEDMKY